MNERLSALSSSIPKFFYDFIVFFSPTVILFIGVGVGAEGWPFVQLQEGPFEFAGASGVLAATVVLVAVSYEYGRIVEALSAPVVQRPLILLNRKTRLLASPDFNRDLTAEVSQLPFTDALDASQRGSKWSLYFFASYVAPALGNDLHKRYAWEKLSRSSALTMLFLTLASLGVLLAQHLGSWDEEFGAFGFGSVIYMTVAPVLCVFSYYEYYRRNCWNNDLLCKTLPVLRLAQSRVESETKQLNPRDELSSSRP